jgi:hypothetical protein|tara:strand:- start:66 stop:1130 length:1065 start_codon:yes stop_codon:yes gene_type:complete
MPMQQVEYEFPDPDKQQEGKEIEVASAEETSEVEVEGAVGREELQKPKKEPTEVKVLAEEEVEVEVVDDTPKADRGRKSSNPPDEVTDEELENYSEKVKKRIKHFSKGYHDERRAKETAERQKEEAIAYAQKLVNENKQLKGNVDKSHNTLIESAKKQVEGEVAIATKKYKEAYESGEPDAIVTAQAELNTAQIRAEKVKGLKPRATTAEAALQAPQNPVQSQLTPAQQPVRDEKAEAWREENVWFGSNDEMTALALGLHTKLTKEGTSPQSDEYYEKINSRMRQLFPAEFDEGIEDEPVGRKPKSSNVVAPATRSTSPKKVTLSQTQVALAKRLGVSLEDYAQQVAELMRKQS